MTLYHAQAATATNMLTIQLGSESDDLTVNSTHLLSKSVLTVTIAELSDVLIKKNVLNVQVDNIWI